MIKRLESERLILLPLGLDFCTQEYVNWLNDSIVNKYLETVGNYTKESLKDFLKDVEQKNILFWAILVKSENKHIGNIKIDPINHRHRVGEYGILMGDKDEWGKGYAEEASKLVIAYCFNELSLRKIVLGVVHKNLNAIKLYKKLGFVQEGLYKKHGVYDSEYCDIIRMAIFNLKYHEET
jgi:ribosomal-protein-alanine N-acetyltransferase